MARQPKRQITTAALAFWGSVAAVLIGLLLWGDGIFGLDQSPIKPTRQLQGEVLGSMPKPTAPKLIDPVVEPFAPKNTRRVVIKRIPMISKGMTMPHPYWGDCTKCHLFKDGPPAGSQWKTPVGNVMEKVSTIHKIGPPILPNSTRPHPAAGRCIKCHDIAVDVPA